MGVDSTTKAWRREHTYGGKLTENVVQAIARDLMALALLRLEAAGYPVVMTVHDEAVVEVIDGLFEPVERVEELMCKVPEWAAGLPVAAEGWTGERYGK
jgi:DNA polymerase